VCLLIKSKKVKFKKREIKNITAENERSNVLGHVAPIDEVSKGNVEARGI
jgi:hypothetical protein